MQVMSKVHHDKFQQLGGVKAALNPMTNIKVGALILKAAKPEVYDKLGRLLYEGLGKE